MSTYDSFGRTRCGCPDNHICGYTCRNVPNLREPLLTSFAVADLASDQLVATMADDSTDFDSFEEDMCQLRADITACAKASEDNSELMRSECSCGSTHTLTYTPPNNEEVDQEILILCNCKASPAVRYGQNDNHRPGCPVYTWFMLFHPKFRCDVLLDHIREFLNLLKN